MADAPSPQDSLGPVGDGEYVVVEGDCVESIAAGAGFLWTTIWDHPQNAALKNARLTQNLLLPGDRVHIPAKELKLVGRPTDQLYHFYARACLANCACALNGLTNLDATLPMCWSSTGLCTKEPPTTKAGLR